MSGGRSVSPGIGSGNRATSETSNVPSEAGVAISRMPGLLVPGPEGSLSADRGLTGVRGLTELGELDGVGEVDGVVGEADGEGRSVGVGELDGLDWAEVGLGAGAAVVGRAGANR